jgi:hypothetical protein
MHNCCKVKVLSNHYHFENMINAIYLKKHTFVTNTALENMTVLSSR